MDKKSSHEQQSIAPEKLVAIRGRDFLVASAVFREAGATAVAYPDAMQTPTTESAPVAEVVEIAAYTAQRNAAQVAQATQAVAAALKAA